MRVKKTSLKMYKARCTLPHLVTWNVASDREAHSGVLRYNRDSNRISSPTQNAWWKRAAGFISNWTVLFLLMISCISGLSPPPRWASSVVGGTSYDLCFSASVKFWPRAMLRQIPLTTQAGSCNWTHGVSCYLIMLLNNISEQHMQTEVGV